METLQQKESLWLPILVFPRSRLPTPNLVTLSSYNCLSRRGQKGVFSSGWVSRPTRARTSKRLAQSSNTVGVIAQLSSTRPRILKNTGTASERKG